MPARQKIGLTGSRRGKRKYWQRVFLLWLFVLILIVGVIFLGRLRQGLGENVWNGRHQINLVWGGGQEVLLSSFLPQEGKLTLFRISGNTFLEVARGFGPYRAEAIFPLGQLKGQGGELLRLTVQENFGLPIDAYLTSQNPCLSQAGLWRTDEAKSCLLASIQPLLLGRVQTSLNWFSLWRFWRSIGSVRVDKIVLIDLAQTKAVSAQVLADGTQVLQLDRERLDGLVSRYFTDPQIVGVDFEVVNATDHAGLAGRVARIMTNTGAQVVKVGDSPGRLTSSSMVILEAKTKEAYPVARFARVFALPVRVGESQSGRAQVKVVLGEDFWNGYFAPFP